jgi:hypothetical protein
VGIQMRVVQDPGRVNVQIVDCQMVSSQIIAGTAICFFTPPSAHPLMQYL